jgi:ADP-heptose:LPS heptosyltransferase
VKQISVIIPVKNGESTLGCCLDMLSRQTIADQLEIIIIDSGSADSSLQIAARYNARVIHIPPEQFNHGLTRNLGVRNATADLVYLTVQDARISTTDMLENMKAHFYDETVLSVCGIQGVPHDAGTNPAAWFKRQTQPFVKTIFFEHGEFNKLGKEEQLRHSRWDNVNAMYRRSALLNIPFQETNFAEDALWASDALRTDGKLIYDPSLLVFHYHHQDFSYAFLLGNESYRSLAEAYDQDVIDEFIWINPSIIYSSNISKKLKLACTLQLKRFDVVINPIHSRLFELDELVASSGGKQLIGSKGDDVNFSSSETYTFSSGFYDKLIPVPGIDTFEYDRNLIFFQNLTRSKIVIPILNMNEKKNHSENTYKIVIFPGAGQSFRKWNPGHFAKTMIGLQEKVIKDIVFFIAGGKDDLGTVKELLSGLQPGISVVDSTGKTELTDLVKLIADAQLLISNETSAVHIAATVHTPAICISNGNHFGRFNPYPATSSNIFTLYPDKKFYDKDYREILIEECKKRSPYDINQINSSEVIDKGIEILTTYAINDFSHCDS